MAPIIDVSDEILRTLNPEVYTLRSDLESSVNQIADLNIRNWIKVPQEFSGLDYGFSVSPERLAYNSAVGKVGKTLDLNLKNTSRDSLGREFVGNINWEESLKTNLLLGNKTPSTLEANKFLNLLYQGMQGKVKVYDEAGKQLDEKFLENIFYDITQLKFSWRAEWFEDKFTFENDELKINNNYILNEAGILIPQSSEILDKDTLMEDKRISLENWLEAPTKQALPTKKTKKGNLHFLCPKRDSVARFVAVDYWAFLNGWCPSGGYSYLGVHAVRRE